MITSALGMKGIVGEHPWKEPQYTGAGNMFTKMKMSFPGGQHVESYFT